MLSGLTICPAVANFL